MPICRSSGAREVWMIECYKYSAPLALSSENLDYNDLLFAQSSIIPAASLPCQTFVLQLFLAKTAM
jgi:hypothetical protein